MAAAVSLRDQGEVESRAHVEDLPLDRSTGCSCRTTGGEAENMDTDAARWVDMVVGARRSSPLIDSIFSERNGSKVIS